MEGLKGKKLPTVEQVEAMITDVGTTSVDVLAERFDLEPVVVKATLDCLRQLRRMPDRQLPAIETTVSNPSSAVRAQSTGMCNRQKRKDVECVL
jgi:hypothetical protein